MIFIFVIACICYVAVLALLDGWERIWCAIILGAAIVVALIFILAGNG